MREEDILFQAGRYFILNGSKAYELCRNGATHSEVIGRYGKQEKYLQMAIERAKALNAEE